MRRSPASALLSPLLTIAPATAAFVAALGLTQIMPVVQAASRPPVFLTGYLPSAKPGAYPAKYRVARPFAPAAPVKFGDWVWDETRAPLTGPVLVTVDIASESLAVYRGGHQIGATRIIYGDDDKPTPIGIFPITEKDARHRSNIFADAPMPYMLRLTGDGISIHGANKVQHIYATNGCVGIPNEFAKRLFAVVILGDRVIITRAKTLRVGDSIATS